MSAAAARRIDPHEHYQLTQITGHGVTSLDVEGWQLVAAFHLAALRQYVTTGGMSSALAGEPVTESVVLHWLHSDPRAASTIGAFL